MFEGFKKAFYFVLVYYRGRQPVGVRSRCFTAQGWPLVGPGAMEKNPKKQWTRELSVMHTRGLRAL